MYYERATGRELIGIENEFVLGRVREAGRNYVQSIRGGSRASGSGPRPSL